MNENTEVSFIDRAKAKARDLGNKAAMTAVGLSASLPAFAQSEVETVIDTQLALALVIVVAGTVALLTIRYSKMSRRA